MMISGWYINGIQLATGSEYKKMAFIAVPLSISVCLIALQHNHTNDRILM